LFDDDVWTHQLQISMSVLGYNAFN
jgi:hypothetical protein